MARIYLLMIVLFATIMSCKPKHEETKTEDSVTTTSSAPVDSAAHPRLNQPTPQQSTDGFVSLFDGKTMNGWEVYKKKENDSWEVADDALHCKPFNENGTNKRADIRTTTEYENFDLMFDFKISPQGNSGVMFRVSEKYDEPYASGPEYQVIDDKGYPGDLKDVQHTAANYDMQVADANKPLKPSRRVEHRPHSSKRQTRRALAERHQSTGIRPRLRRLEETPQEQQVERFSRLRINTERLHRFTGPR